MESRLEELYAGLLELLVAFGYRRHKVNGMKHAPDAFGEEMMH